MSYNAAKRLLAGLVAGWCAATVQGQGHDVPHVEDFEGFDLGPLAPQGGWEAPPGRNALVVEEQARSGRQSVKIVADEGGQRDTDLYMQYARIHPFSGCYRYSVYHYLPSTQTGETYFILMSEFNRGGKITWAVQVHFNARSGQVCADFGDDCLPVITDQWTEFAIDIDYDQDLHQIYYGGQPLFHQPKSWENAMNGGNPPQVGASNWYNNDSCCQYYDDLDFQKVECKPSCQYTIRKGKAKEGCEACPQRGSVYEVQGWCGSPRDCPMKLKETIDCPHGRGSCKINAKRRACE